MRLFIALLFALLLTTTAGAQSQASPPASSTGGVLGGAITPGGVVSSSSGGGWAFAGLGPGTPSSGVVGVPYSAEQVTEHVQTLADGTHIGQPSQTTKFYRDSQGRTRTERSFPLPPGAVAKGTDAPSFVEITDPVAGVRYTLEPRNRTAHRMSMPAVPPPPPLASGTNASAASMIRLLPAQLSPPASAPQDQTPRPQFSRESLGTQTIEGVLAEGSRITVTYPIGSVGNDRSITTVSETVDVARTEDGRSFEEFGPAQRRLHNQAHEHVPFGARSIAVSDSLRLRSN